MQDKRFSGRLAMAAFGVCAAALVGCGPKKEEKLPNLPAVQPSLVDRVRVLGPDAFVIDGTHVRLTGVYAPQGPPDARCWAEALASKQATDAVRQLIVNGRTISFSATGGKDVFERIYARVTLNGVDLGETLYDEGMVAKQPTYFGWCRPISEREAGAPDLTAVMDPGY